MAKKKVFSIGTALSQGLEDTIESAQSYSGELRIDVIPLRKIELDPANPRDLLLTMADAQYGINPVDAERTRKEAELESLQSIASSIKSQGIINPITVYKHGDKYRLIAGERRTLASLIAGRSDIQAKILDDKPDALKISLLQWIENIERTDLSLWERLTNLEKIVTAYTKPKSIDPSRVTVTELSELIGCVKSHAINYKALLNADTELKRLVFEGKINNLKKAAFISEIEAVATKQQVIQACVAGATLEQLKTIVNKASIQPASLKPIERRGRQTSSINLGVTKHANVAKIIMDSILKNASLSHMTEQFKEMDWKNPRAISESFRQLLKTLEKMNV